MKSQQFQDILNAVPLLTNQQRNTLISALSEENPSTDIAKTIEESFVRAPKCPHCGSESLQRWGGWESSPAFSVQDLPKNLERLFQNTLGPFKAP